MRQAFLPCTLTVALALGGCSGGTTGAGALPQRSAIPQSAQRVLRSPLGPHSIVESRASAGRARLCAPPKDAAHASCFASVRTDSSISSIAADIVSGLAPQDLSTLYNFPAPGMQGGAGSGQTVAVVEAGDYAQAESDLSVYRTHFGLPQCQSWNGCLRKVGAGYTGTTSATGSSTSISAHATTTAAQLTALGWDAETDTDTEIVSAVCPQCRIIIAEAASNSLADLSAAVTAAVNAGATIVNTSFGAPESAADAQFSPAYSNSRHVKVVSASGDWGFGVYYPASDPNVVAVGGTTISVVGTTVTEAAWGGSGSGCSTVFAGPAWQHPPAVAGACQMRNVADVSADADPLTGVAVYDSELASPQVGQLFGFFNVMIPAQGGWAIFGGTSVAAPIVASMYALSGDTSRNVGAQTLYSDPTSAFLQVTSGSNGTCSPLYLCTALPGYNGPTGLGVPDGLSSF